MAFSGKNTAGSSPSGESAAGSRTARIARNSFWFGLETAWEILVTVAASVATARIIGPERLGYFTYLAWLTAIGASVSNIGVPGAMRKYMAECLGRGQEGLARGIFFRSLRHQALIGAAVTAAGLALSLTAAPAEHRTVAVLLVLTMFFQMLRSLPCMANVAREWAAGNVPASLIGSLIYAGLVAAALLEGWGVTGLAAALLVQRSVEVALRMAMIWGWLRQHAAEAVPPDLGRRLLVFSGQGMALWILRLVVWDRAGVVFLERFHPDIRQVTFYSLTFMVTERLYQLPQIFAFASGSTLMAEYGRSPQRMVAIATTTVRYLALVSAPLFAGLAAVSALAMPLMFGSAYRDAIPALAAMALFSLPKALMWTGMDLLQASERQRTLLGWTAAASAACVALHLLLIPRWGAAGAAVAGGAGQALAIAGFWISVRRLYPGALPAESLARIAGAAAAMAAAAWALARWLHGWTGLAAAVAAGAIVYVLGIRMLSVLGPADRWRLSGAFQRLPAPARSGLDWMIGQLVPAARSPGGAAVSEGGKG